MCNLYRQRNTEDLSRLFDARPLGLPFEARPDIYPTYEAVVVRKEGGERLLDCMAGEDGRLPWIAVFALRWVSYDDISDVLSNFGLVTEKLADHTFTQRRFTGAEEREYVLEELAEMDVDTTGREDTGWYHANFYLSRPVEEASVPLKALLDL